MLSRLKQYIERMDDLWEKDEWEDRGHYAEKVYYNFIPIKKTLIPSREKNKKKSY